MDGCLQRDAVFSCGMLPSDTLGTCGMKCLPGLVVGHLRRLEPAIKANDPSLQPSCSAMAWLKPSLAGNALIEIRNLSLKLGRILLHFAGSYWPLCQTSSGPESV